MRRFLLSYVLASITNVLARRVAGWTVGRVVTGYMSTNVASGWRDDVCRISGVLCFLPIDGFELDIAAIALAFRFAACALIRR